MIKNHPQPWTSKKEVLETIKKLYFKCGGDANYEYLYILPSKWIDLLKYKIIGDEIYEHFQNAYCTPLEFLIEENFDIWHPKIHGPRNYLQSFYLADLIQKYGEKLIIHMHNFEMVFQEKGQNHLIMKVITMELLRHLLIMKRHRKLRKLLE